MALVHVLLLIGCALAIYVACDWFVNAVEWLGVELKVATMAVGTVLAAIGTALPESVVTLVAVLFGSPGSGKEIGVGAALGGPLVLSTLAYGIVGVLLLRRGGRDGLARVDRPRLRMDQRWFLAISGTGLLLGLVAFHGKALFGVAFLVAYALYVRRELSTGDEAHSADDLASLRIWRSDTPPTRLAIGFQTAGSLVVVVVASQLFVRQLEWAGPAVGLPPAAVALLLAPIATELPEILNAVIWVRQGKSTLAMANISGSMMVQATVPAAIGLFFTPWDFDAVLVSASVATLGAVGYQLLVVRGRRFTPAWLAATVGFYAAFAMALALEVG